MALSPGSPVLVVRRVARTGARPVELSESVLDAAVHVLRYDLPAVTSRTAPADGTPPG
jgi:DNA-binding GntR family transcriptional regulator